MPNHNHPKEPVKHTPGCIEWDGAIDANGYGRKNVKDKWCAAHRLAWEKVNGKIPDDLQIDHVCRNRKCVNPNHLELVTRKENILRGIGPTAINARKRRCTKGHLLEGDNLRIRPSGRRECKECGRARWRAYRKRKIQEGTWRS